MLPMKTGEDRGGAPAGPVATTGGTPHPGGTTVARHTVESKVWVDHVRYAEEADPAALDRLVREYDRYARSLAARMQRGREPRDDLDQVAREALVVALVRFEPDRQVPFVAFATPTILGALRRHYRDRGWLLRVPRAVHEMTTAARAATERLTTDLGRHPSVAEVADAMGVDVEELLVAQEAAFARDASSIDAPGVDGLTLGGRLGTGDHDLALADDRLALADAMDAIDARGQHVLRLYYFEECTQAEIGHRLGISQMQVSRLITTILRRLRSQMAAT